MMKLLKLYRGLLEMNSNKMEIASSYRVILGYVGFCIFLVGAAILSSLLTIIFYPEEACFAKYFLYPGILSVVVGLALFLPIYKKKKVELYSNHETIIVFLSWLFAIFICAIPYFLTGEYTFTQSMYESTSGLTTTGLTVMDVESLPKIFLMYRSITSYVGGIGIILIMTSLFASVFGMRLYNAEGHQNKLIANVIGSSRMIVVIYTGYMIVGAILFMIFGMQPFDAINHSISAVANGGFSTKAASIGYYNSLPIEIITMTLAVLGGTNFLLNLMLIKGNFKAFFKHCETKLMVILWAIFAPILACILMGTVCVTFGEGFRVALFQIISVMTTSGFSTVDTLASWPAAGIVVLILFMLVGLGAGSTAGGIKLYRMAIVFKSIYYDIKSKLMPKRAVISKKINFYGKDVELTSERVFEAHNFVMMYFVVLFIGTLIVSACGNSVGNSFFEVISALSCVGVSIGVSGKGACDVVNWVEIVAMLIGRLDIYPVILTGLVVGKDFKESIKKSNERKELNV